MSPKRFEQRKAPAPLSGATELDGLAVVPACWEKDFDKVYDEGYDKEYQR